MKEVVFYRTASGHCPVKAFLDSLSGRQARKAIWILRLIEEMDTVPRQYFKKLSGGTEIWEARVEVGGEALRFLGFLHKGSFLVLTHAFNKKTQKTPLSDIHLAERRKQDHLKRNA